MPRASASGRKPAASASGRKRAAGAPGGKPHIIAEKPSAAQAFADALGGFSRRNGYLESDAYVLSWALGHLVEQQAPEDYDPRWKRWSLATLPILPAAFRTKVVAKTRGQFEVLASLARSAPELVNACDAGREGELIFRYICESAAAARPARRLWVSSLTREAIRKAFADLRPAADYDRLYQSALCRAQGDWLVGMNATRAFTVRWGELLSVGRVQTPTLAMLVRREREIDVFVPEDYWEVLADFALADRRHYPGKWLGPENRRASREEAEAVAARVQGQPGAVSSVEEKNVTERPPQLYDLTSLQRDANRRYSLTAAATLKAAQALYEHKLVTYPRTDSRYLTRDLVPTLPGLLQAVAAGGEEYRTLAAGADPGRVHPGNRRVVDDAKVTDHHAILPTREMPAGLSGANARVYGLIVRRFLAQFYPDARYLEVEVLTTAGPAADRFRSRGRRTLEAGWRVVEPEPTRSRQAPGEDAEEAGPLPPLQADEAVTATKAEAMERTTQPPRRYTEATLLSAMEFAGREMDDETLRDAMKGHGLGTPATRAAIIERLKQVGYVGLEKKSIVPTAKGRQLVALAETAGAQALLSPELTGEWERRIADIQAGAYPPEQFMTEIRGLTVQVVEGVRGAAGPAANEAAAAGPAAEPGEGEAVVAPQGDSQAPGLTLAAPCPRCGGQVAKDSKGWSCASADCTTRVPRYLCGKVMEPGWAEALMKKGKTPLITDFRSARTGRTFAAYLLLAEDGVRFEFPPDRPRRGSRAGTAKRSGRSAAGKSPGAKGRKTEAPLP